MDNLIKIKAVVNFAKPYRVAEGGTTNEGITIHYLMTDSLKPYEDETSGAKGFKSTKSSLSLSLANKLIAVPGQYELSCELGVNSNGNPQLKPVDIEFLSYCDFKFADSVEGLSDTGKLPAPSSVAQPEQTGQDTNKKQVKEAKK